MISRELSLVICRFLLFFSSPFSVLGNWSAGSNQCMVNLFTFLIGLKIVWLLLVRGAICQKPDFKGWLWSYKYVSRRDKISICWVEITRASSFPQVCHGPLRCCGRSSRVIDAGWCVSSFPDTSHSGPTGYLPQCVTAFALFIVPFVDLYGSPWQEMVNASKFQLISHFFAHKKEKESPQDQIVWEPNCAEASLLVERGLGSPRHTAQHCSLICLSRLLMAGI